MSMLSKLQKLWENPPEGPSLVGGAKAAWEAMKAPGKAYNEGMTPDEMIKAGNDFALTLGTGGSLVPKPGNSVGIFGGRLAKTANLDALASAQRLEKAGVRPDDIWKMSGWGRGKDGQWRFEIPDQKSSLDMSKLKMKPTFTGDAFDHPELYAAYPDLAFGSIRRTGSRAKYNGANYGNNEVALNSKSRDPRSTMLHELQHSVQDIEGFAQGSNPNKAYNQINMALLDNLDFNKVLWEKFMGKHGPDFKHKLYKHFAGETEARSVQARKDYTPLQRRLRSPWMDEDVPRQSQLPIGQRNE